VGDYSRRIGHSGDVLPQLKGYAVSDATLPNDNEFDKFMALLGKAARRCKECVSVRGWSLGSENGKE
jgi:hypothetical protein